MAEARKPIALDYAFLALLALATFDALARTDAPERWGSVLFLGATLYARAWRLLPAALLIFYLYVGGLFYPAFIWNVPAAPFLVPFALTVVTCLPFPEVRARFGWLRRGETSQITWFLVALVSLVSALALVLWALWTNYLGVASAMMSSYRGLPVWFMLFVGIPVFALLNAFAEEVVYRGVIQDALESGFPAREALVLAFQASAFAAVHYRGGFPNGNVGYLMTFLYAVALGWLRHRTRGLLAPWTAHVAADAVIGVTLLLLSA